MSGGGSVGRGVSVASLAGVDVGSEVEEEVGDGSGLGVRVDGADLLTVADGTAVGSADVLRAVGRCDGGAAVLDSRAGASDGVGEADGEVAGAVVSPVPGGVSPMCAAVNASTPMPTAAAQPAVARIRAAGRRLRPPPRSRQGRAGRLGRSAAGPRLRGRPRAPRPDSRTPGPPGRAGR